MYNLTNITGANNYYEQVVAVNSLTSGMMGIMIIGSIFFILFFALKKSDPENGLIAASFITTVIAILFVFINLTSWSMVMIGIVIFVATIIYKLMRGD